MRNTGFSTTTILCLAVIMFLKATTVHATSVYLVTAPQPKIDTTFCAAISVDSVDDFYGAAFDVIYDPLMVEIVDSDPETVGVQPEIIEGDLLNDNSTAVTYVAAALEDSEAGKLVVGITRSGPVAGVAAGASSDIGTVCFTALQTGNTTIIFDKSSLKDSTGADIAIAGWVGANITIISDPDLFIQNITFDSNDTRTFTTTNSITAGNNVTNDKPIGPVVIEPGADLTLKSKTIIFKPGVHVQEGSKLNVISQ